MDRTGNENVNITDEAVGKDSLIFTGSDRISCPEAGSFDKYELLSPAGDMDCLYAAIASGADAVYAGGDRFGARAYADNFDEDGMKRAINYVHLFGKKLYLTVNTLVKEKEFDGLYGFIKPFYEEGLDGVIIQDLGVVSFLRENFPYLKLHASTQMSINTAYGAKLLKNLGIERIVPARELSLEEVRSLRGQSGMEIECFIHGAMCYSYSGQCLMSSFLGGRSGNRGRCAGTCRLPYSSGKIREKYLLSMKDMCTIDILPKLMEAGVCSYKIEGRMKPPSYVAGVTGIYRKYMDMYIKGKGKGYRVSKEDRDKLLSIYSRGGISSGYYERRNSLSMITLEKTGYQSALKTEKEESTGRLKKDVTAYCEVIRDRNIKLTLNAGSVSVTEEGQAAEDARNRALTQKDIKKQITKTGNLDFNISEVYINTDEASFVPVSVLNELRRNAFIKLYDSLNAAYKRKL